MVEAIVFIPVYMSASNETINVSWLEQNGMHYKAIKLNNFMIITFFFFTVFWLWCEGYYDLIKWHKFYFCVIFKKFLVIFHLEIFLKITQKMC